MYVQQDLTTASWVDGKARLLGAAIIAAGSGIAWLAMIRPLQQAHAGAASVTMSIKAFLVAPMLLCAGLVLLLGGAVVMNAFRTPPSGRQQHLIVWGTAVATLLSGAIGFWWFQQQLSILGYA